MASIPDRLKTARIAAGFPYASNAANALGLPNSTYVGHESGKRGIATGRLERYAAFFKVDFTWLATGTGSPPEVDEVGPDATAG